MWFRNLIVHRIFPDAALTAAALEEKLARCMLQPCGSFEMESRGWLAPRNDGGLVYALQKQWLISLGMNQKLLPASVVNEAVRERAQALAASQGRPVGRKQLRDIRERTLTELMPKALTRRRVLHAWIDPAHGWLAVNTAAEKQAAVLIEALRKDCPELAARRLDTACSPASAMTQWVSAGAPPAGFTIDQDLELRAPDASRAVVRYMRHPLDGREIRDHIAAGKTAARLALTWKDRISFVLTGELQVKQLDFLDVLREEARGAGEDANGRFDTEFALMTGELARLIADLVRALGGEKAETEESRAAA
jgi:recombination associated protein RdgC